MPSQRIAKKLDADGLWNYALRAITQRPHSVAEIRTKLARRAESPDLLSPTLEKLREYGFADDEKFSQAYATARLENQGFGRARVMRDLQAKRVGSKTAEQAIANVFNTVDENSLVDQYLQRKYRGKDLTTYLKEEKNLASVYRRLRTAGFSSANSIAALKRFRDDVPEVDESEEVED